MVLLESKISLTTGDSAPDFSLKGIDNAMNPDDTATENTMQKNIEKYLAGEKIEKDFDPSIGCSIKWKGQQT